MMPITLFKSISYPSQNHKASFKYAENTSKQIQPHNMDAINYIMYTFPKHTENTNNAVTECPWVSWGNQTDRS